MCGLTFVEVLVSLVLMTSLSLSLLTQQWRVTQLFNQIQDGAQALVLLDNASEQWLAGASVPSSTKPFQLDITSVGLQIKWLSNQETILLQRSLEPG